MSNKYGRPFKIRRDRHMSHERTLGVGIVGLGTRGFWNLGRNILKLSNEVGLNLVAVCDRNPLRVDEAINCVREEYPQAAPPKGYSDYQQLIDDPAVDIVMITTQTYQHRGPVVAAMRSGKKTFCEKPLGHTAEECAAIYEAERESGNTVMMGFTRRYERPWIRATELVENGVIGDVRMLLLRAVIPYDVYFHRWHRERRYSGDALNDKSSHHFDVFSWFAGADPRHVHAFGGRHVFLPEENAPFRCAECDRECPYRVRGMAQNETKLAAKTQPSVANATDVLHAHDVCVYYPGADILDHAVVSVEYANDVRATLFWTVYGPKAPDQESLEIVGTKGKILLTRETGTLEVITDHGRNRFIEEAKDTENAGFGHFGADRRLVETLAEFGRGGRSTVSCRGGLAATSVVEAAIQSIEERRVVTLPTLDGVGLAAGETVRLKGVAPDEDRSA